MQQLLNLVRSEIKYRINAHCILNRTRSKFRPLRLRTAYVLCVSMGPELLVLVEIAGHARQQHAVPEHGAGIARSQSGYRRPRVLGLGVVLLDWFRRSSTKVLLHWLLRSMSSTPGWGMR